MLENVSVIKCELSFFDYYEKSNSFFELESVMRKHDFALYSIPFISQNPNNGRTDWVETIYVKRSLI